MNLVHPSLWLTLGLSPGNFEWLNGAICGIIVIYLFIFICCYINKCYDVVSMHKNENFFSNQCY